MLNTSWTVPNKPEIPFGSNAPGWWFGVQTAEGDGALIQPILAYGYKGAEYSIFNGVFDWTDGSWRTSPEVYTVQPGSFITSSVIFNGVEANSYTMIITDGTQTITTPYRIEAAQHKNESTAYFVLEHQPNNCKAYPKDGECTFESIYMEVDGKPVTPTWTAAQERPACNSKCEVVDSKTIKFTWDDSSTEGAAPPAAASNSTAAASLKVPPPLPKWGYGKLL
eukprot:gene7264-33170_t